MEAEELGHADVRELRWEIMNNMEICPEVLKYFNLHVDFCT